MDIRLRRWGALSGWALILLLVVSNGFLAPARSVDGAPLGRQVDAFAANSDRILLGVSLGSFAVVLFLAFGVAFLRAVQPAGGAVVMLAFGGLLISAGMELVVDALVAALTFASRAGEVSTVATLLPLAKAAGFFLGVPNALFAGAVASLILGTGRTVPRWLGWSAAAIACISLVAVPAVLLVDRLAPASFGAFLFLLVWIAASSTAMYRGTRMPAA